ncbi:hypothetical protein AN642_02355 [Epulopiscium sp. SCG-B10WGA-EpuloA2]|nr:hypothetical protein AN642_02355 [Epulopiscium sp. SCG-B10WGA-EpuloA2]
MNLISSLTTSTSTLLPKLPALNVREMYHLMHPIIFCPSIFIISLFEVVIIGATFISIHHIGRIVTSNTHGYH